MADHSNYFDALYKKVDECKDCRDGNEDIGKLPKEDFRFRWYPYSSGEPPFAYIFLGYEPSSTGEKEGATYPEYTLFNEPLQFAIREFLVFPPGRKNIYITNMAKCSVNKEHRDLTRWFRFRTCAWVLHRELELAQCDSARPGIVSIGVAPRDFILKNPKEYGGFFTGRTIHKITHYSRRNGFRFKRFATERTAEYDQFCTGVRNKYADFLSGFRKDFLGAAVDPGIKLTEGDLQRLFLWSKEMRAICEDLP